MKGISMWLFSKIVMLVFLLATFSTVIGFLKMTNEKVSTDSAEALAMQIKDAIQTTVHTNTVSSTAVVPIPKTLPETGGSVQTGKLKTYTVEIGKSLSSGGGDIVYVAIGWGENPTSYTAASSFMISAIDMLPLDGLAFFSNYSYFIVTSRESGKKLCFKACPYSDLTAGCIGCI